MITSELIDDFSIFAKARLGVDACASIDELYDEWRQKAFRDLDAAAIAASLRDVERGERGEPVETFLADFEERQKEEK